MPTQNAKSLTPWSSCTNVLRQARLLSGGDELQFDSEGGAEETGGAESEVGGSDSGGAEGRETDV